MKTSLIRFCVAFASLAVFGQGAFADVTFTVTPSAVSNSWNGVITLQMSGLASGDTVVVQKYLDANTNGVVNGIDRHLDMFSRENFNNAKFNGEKNEN